MRVLVSGSHGLIGTRLLERLAEEGHQPVRLVRVAENESEIRWDPYRGPIDIRELELFDAVIHLGGISIGEKRWTENEKERLWNSRILSTDALVKSFAQLATPPKTFICASAVGYYGDQGDTELTEDSGAGEGFMAGLCAQWERSAAVAAEQDIRVASIRSGVVFSSEGGILKRQLPLFRLGMGGRLGSGRQWMSWIDLDDEVNAIIHVLTHPELSGPINLTSPEPIMNLPFTKLMGLILRRPTVVPAPRWMIALALGGQITDEMLLASQRALPKKLLDSGFTFKHPLPAESLVRWLSPVDLHLFEEAGGTMDLGPRPVIEREIGEGNGPDDNGRHGGRPNGS